MITYHARGYINPSLPVLECARCGALVVRDDEDYARANHDAFHDQIDAAAARMGENDA